MNHWTVGWTDWNMVLDERGGPNWAGFSADAAVIVNGTADEFYKQPMFYALGHFSKYVPEGSIRIDSRLDVNDANLFVAAFQLPDGKRTAVILNRSDLEKAIVLTDNERGQVEFNCPPRSLHTIIYG